jgi:hypothetical protein
MLDALAGVIAKLEERVMARIAELPPRAIR